MSEWETYCDESYYHLWRVRRNNERNFDDGFHLQNGEEAKGLCEFLNKLETELAAVTKQRDAARSYKRVLKNENQRLRSAIRKIGQLSHTTDQSAFWNAIEDAQRILSEDSKAIARASIEALKDHCSKVNPTWAWLMREVLEIVDPQSSENSQADRPKSSELPDKSSELTSVTEDSTERRER